MGGLRKYQNALKDMLPCSKNEKQYYLSRIKQTLGKDAERLSYEAVIERIGTPEEVAASAIQDMDAKEIASAMKKRNRLIQLVSILVGAALLIWAVAVTIALIDSKNQKISYSVIDPITIIETSVSP